MLMAAFLSMAVVSVTGSAWLGLLAGIAAAMVLALLFSVMTARFGGNDIVVSIAINLLVVGLTGYLLRTSVTDGVLRPARFSGLPVISVPGLDQIPLLGVVFRQQSVLTYLALGAIYLTWRLLFRTPLGLMLRAVGDHPEAVSTAGVKPARIKLIANLYGALLAGMGGTQVAYYASEFTERMIASRSFTGFSIAIFGQLQPVFSGLSTVLFGFAETASIRLQLAGVNIAPSLLLMLPFVLATLALCFSSAIIVRRRRRMGHRELSKHA